MKYLRRIARVQYVQIRTYILFILISYAHPYPPSRQDQINLLLVHVRIFLPVSAPFVIYCADLFAGMLLKASLWLVGLLTEMPLLEAP